MIRWIILAIAMASSLVKAQEASPWLVREDGVLKLSTGGFEISFKYILLKEPDYQLGIVFGTDTTIGYQRDQFGLLKLGIIIKE